MKLIVAIVFLFFLSFSLSAKNLDVNSNKSEAESFEYNTWGTKMRKSPFGLGLDLQTKYIWRGMEMMAQESSPVLFPSVNYSWNGLFVYAMGGYAVNGEYAEVDLGISYTLKGFTLGFNDYYYPTVDSNKDNYFGGENTGHWLEATLTYAPEKIPVWITVSNFFYGADKYVDDNGRKNRLTHLM